LLVACFDSCACPCLKTVQQKERERERERERENKRIKVNFHANKFQLTLSHYTSKLCDHLSEKWEKHSSDDERKSLTSASDLIECVTTSRRRVLIGLESLNSRSFLVRIVCFKALNQGRFAREDLFPVRICIDKQAEQARQTRPWSPWTQQMFGLPFRVEKSVNSKCKSLFDRPSFSIIYSKTSRNWPFRRRNFRVGLILFEINY
jgi:hypothetical protein